MNVHARSDEVETGTYEIRVTGANDADYQDPQISKSIYFTIEIYESCETELESTSTIEDFVY